MATCNQHQRHLSLSNKFQDEPEADLQTLQQCDISKSYLKNPLQQIQQLFIPDFQQILPQILSGGSECLSHSLLEKTLIA